MKLQIKIIATLINIIKKNVFERRTNFSLCTHHVHIHTYKYIAQLFEWSVPILH